ncbi:hypothetical protein, partial [Vibrio parahaemolyticus]
VTKLLLPQKYPMFDELMATDDVMVDDPPAGTDHLMPTVGPAGPVYSDCPVCCALRPDCPQGCTVADGEVVGVIELVIEEEAVPESDKECVGV